MKSPWVIIHINNVYYYLDISSISPNKPIINLVSILSDTNQDNQNCIRYNIFDIYNNDNNEPTNEKIKANKNDNNNNNLELDIQPTRVNSQTNLLQTQEEIINKNITKEEFEIKGEKSEYKEDTENIENLNKNTDIFNENKNNNENNENINVTNKQQILNEDHLDNSLEKHLNKNIDSSDSSDPTDFSNKIVELLPLTKDFLNHFEIVPDDQKEHIFLAIDNHSM